MKKRKYGFYVCLIFCLNADFFFANSMSGFEENNDRGVEFEETEKSRSRSEFGSKLNYSIIPRTTLPSSHIDDHDDDDDEI